MLIATILLHGVTRQALRQPRVGVLLPRCSPELGSAQFLGAFAHLRRSWR
jgi:hypothetical protein